jgi:hypothetical protein
MAKDLSELMLHMFIRTGERRSLLPTTRAGLLKKMDARWYLKGLVRDHAKILNHKITAMGKELDARVEIGITQHLKSDYFTVGERGSWPYFSIAQFEEGELKQGFVIIPCAANYWLPTRMSTASGVIRLPVWDGWGPLTPVKQEIGGSKGQMIEVTPDQLADADTVRKGDCYIVNLTACPVVHYRRQTLGTAVTFAGIDEAIDTVRCRLAFGMLPSA